MTQIRVTPTIIAIKPCLLLLLTSLINFYGYSQTIDSANTVDINDNQRLLQSRRLNNSGGMIVGNKNIIIATNNIQMSAIETEISELESREAVAVKERDTIVLKNLWARDFTLDKGQNELLYSNNTLPYYLYFGRYVEKITVLDENTVFTSGYEMFQEIKVDQKIEPERKREYFHTWKRKSGKWKLTTKAHA